MHLIELYERLLSLGRFASVRRLVTTLCVVLSALLQAYVIEAFIIPANLLSGGFTGAAILIDRTTSLFGISIPISVGMLALNIPVALACWKSISKRFVIFSMLQVALLSLFLEIFEFPALLPGDTVLEVLFGGVLIGLSTVVALKGGASTAGTDFIALFVSNRTGKTIWTPVFIGNCIMLLIFGSIFGWRPAAYSIVFQFIATKTVDEFYHRYQRSVLLVTTKQPTEVARAYTQEMDHGASIIDATGAFSGEPVGIIHAVLSTYEVSDAIKLIRSVDSRAVINVMPNENFVGNFRHDGIDEPLPTKVKATPPVDPLLASMAKLRRYAGFRPGMVQHEKRPPQN
ncbi:YitT family protein [Collinsella sp. zg1085]|uniref:YitT family protein n=1 Tax=Collinsella sp. zg1085 TaxID=2844380 RepID=UPI001C0D6299|nr:YitT family protein [Collinsella sp. zg1085]QWT17752.1 YitT family protein [Collinsella sp. zg1085]